MIKSKTTNTLKGRCAGFQHDLDLFLAKQNVDVLLIVGIGLQNIETYKEGFIKSNFRKSFFLLPH